MKIFANCLLLFSVARGLVISEADGPANYDGYKVVRINTDNQLQVVKSKLSTITYSQWLNAPTYTDIMVSPDQLTAFQALKLEYTVMHEDLGVSITAESAQGAQVSSSAVDESWFQTYHPYADHEKWLRNLQKQYANHSEIFSSGRSTQGRDLFGIHLWGAGGPGKPAVLWHGNVHAREWITSMVVEYLTLQLVTEYEDGDMLVISFLDKFDFYIIPFVNPDGFVYSQSSDRLWRKNRQSPPRGSCIGRDINRQWPYQWDSNPDGASPNPCDETYRGETASDSSESRGLVSLVNKLRDSNTIKLYIDWHSYGQYILTPWGYTCDILPADSNAHINLASNVSAAIKQYAGMTYTFGPSCATLYPTTGDSTDYLHGPGASDWTFTIELRDTGDNGFVLPASQILPSGKEQWEAMKVMLASI